MFLRIAVALSVVAAATPALAEPLGADAARRFVAGKLFSFTCFEGTTGSGRIFHDGSVVGMMRMQGSGPLRFMRMPAGTLYARGETVCSHVKGAFFNPCFNLNKTSEKSFRGAVSGFGFAYCDFTRGSRPEVLRASVSSEETSARASIRRGHKPRHEQPAAAPTQPVTSAPLPAEQAVMRSSIAP
jgi:hypothetical protein